MSAAYTIKPTYITCPFCPAQAFPVGDPKRVENMNLLKFVCPARHTFLLNLMEGDDVREE